MYIYDTLTCILSAQPQIDTVMVVCDPFISSEIVHEFICQ